MRPAPLLALLATLSGCQLFFDPSDVDAPAPPDACVPQTCADLGASCGEIDDGCGGRVSCPIRCAPPETCGGDGTPNACGRQEMCTAAGWCWENPLPQGEDLNAAHAFGPDDLWVGGNHGTLLRWDGSAWTRRDLGVAEGVLDLWGAAPDDVWLVTEGYLIHWDGERFDRRPNLDRYLTLTGFSTGEVWAGGVGGVVARWDGSAWGKASAPGPAKDVRAIESCGDGTAWAVGNGGLALRYEAGAWRAEPPPPGVSGSLYAAWCSSGSAWAVGAAGLVLRWTAGEGWSKRDAGVTEDLFAVAGAASDDVWALGMEGTLLRWDGQRWTPHAQGLAPDIRGGALLATSATDLWAFGSKGGMLHFDGLGWSAFSKGDVRWLTSLWGFADGDVWAVGGVDSAVILRRTPEGRWEPAVHSGQSPLASIHGSAPNDVWAVGRDGESDHWNGSSWKRVTTRQSEDLFGVHAFGATALAVGDRGTILEWTGSLWTEQTSGTAAGLQGVWGTSAEDAWAAGDATVLRRLGDGWAKVGPEGIDITCALVGLWGFDDGDVWVTTHDPACGYYRYRAGWTRFSVTGAPSFMEPHRPWGPTSDDLWSPADGSLQHFRGSKWSPVEVGASPRLTGVWGTGGRVWVVGEGGAVLRYGK